jgi:hypothetical protein
MTINIPHDPPGGAELAARRTAAAAVLADYKRAVDGADTAERAMWGSAPGRRAGVPAGRAARRRPEVSAAGTA